MSVCVFTTYRPYHLCPAHLPIANLDPDIISTFHHLQSLSLPSLVLRHFYRQWPKRLWIPVTADSFMQIMLKKTQTKTIKSLFDILRHLHIYSRLPPLLLNHHLQSLSLPFSCSVIFMNKGSGKQIGYGFS